MYGASLMRNEPSKQLCILCKRKPLGIYVKGLTSCKNKKPHSLERDMGLPLAFVDTLFYIVYSSLIKQ